MSYCLFCVVVERRETGEALTVMKIATSTVEFETGFQIIQSHAGDSGRDDRCDYHIHFTCPLVPTHKLEIAREAAVYGLNCRELEGICRDAIASNKAISKRQASTAR